MAINLFFYLKKMLLNIAKVSHDELETIRRQKCNKYSE